jgi:hypothetical protein
MEQETQVEAATGLEAQLEQALKRAEELQEALDSRIEIEQAKGVLRERFGWDVDDAFEILRYAARSSRVQIHDLAREVVASDETPDPVVIALARGARWRAAHMREHAEAQRLRASELETLIRAQRERLVGWPARGDRPAEPQQQPPPRRGSGPALSVVAPTYASARQLLQRTSIVFTAEVTPSSDGRWEVKLYEGGAPGRAGGSEELVHRALGIVQEWVRELDAVVEVVLDDRSYTIHPR